MMLKRKMLDKLRSLKQELRGTQAPRLEGAAPPVPHGHKKRRRENPPPSPSTVFRGWTIVGNPLGFN